MKIILNGATAGTNFGDFLFAKMFGDCVGEKIGIDNVFWYDSRFSLSDFYKRHLKYNKKCQLKDIDALVYISGGYFCGNDKCLKHRIIRVLSYFVIGFRCIFKKIPYGIFGVEVSNTKPYWLRCIEKNILKNAKIVTVRNKESLEALKSYGIENGILTADSVFAMETSFFNDSSISSGILNSTTKKLFLHIHPNKETNNRELGKILLGLNTFLRNHPEYSVVIGMDQYVSEQKEIMDDMATRLKCNNIIYNYYDNPVELCKVLDSMDCIITTKLHVGIVGARLNKPVISFSGHTEKIERLYKQLNISSRSISLKECNDVIVNDMLEKYHNVPVTIPDEVVQAAKRNFELLNAFIGEL